MKPEKEVRSLGVKTALVRRFWNHETERDCVLTGAHEVPAWLAQSNLLGFALPSSLASSSLRP